MTTAPPPTSAQGRRHTIDISNMHLRFKGSLKDADELLAMLQGVLKPSIIEATVKDLTLGAEWEKIQP